VAYASCAIYYNIDILPERLKRAEYKKDAELVNRIKHISQVRLKTNKFLRRIYISEYRGCHQSCANNRYCLLSEQKLTHRSFSQNTPDSFNIGEAICLRQLLKNC